jgi:hypothetical protein
MPWSKDFAQVTDAEVCDPLARAWQHRLVGGQLMGDSCCQAPSTPG